jgi:hypothetical protein
MLWIAATIAIYLGIEPPVQGYQPSRWTASAGKPDTRQWEPYAILFTGPPLNEATASPNPILDYRLQVTFTAPSGAQFVVPGFFDGNGSGSGVGPIWKVRFAADEEGTWEYVASFRQGPALAVNLDLTAGTPLAFDGEQGTFDVAAPLPGAPGFLGRGRLEYADGHYLRFQDGSHFIKTGTDSPENFFGYKGFDGVLDLGGAAHGIVHTYGPHVADWNPGDPYVGAAGSPSGLKGIIGALNYLSESGVNAIYFLPMNLGGDGAETAPFLVYEKSSYGKTHYDISRLEQWNTVLEHAMRRGIVAQLVLSETESDNEKWLDEGLLGTERKLFFRELSARFGHNLGLKWNLGEESDYSVSLLKSMAAYIDAVDPYDHPIAVHTYVDDFSDYYALLGDPAFSTTSIQYTNGLAGEFVEDWRGLSAASGHPWVIEMDENGTALYGVTDLNAEQFRKEVLYDILFSGGSLEWYLGAQWLPLGGDLSVEDFRTRDDMWRYSRIARELLEQDFEFWNMQPADALLTGEAGAYGGGEVFALGNRDFAVYLPSASSGGTLNLTSAPGALFWVRWFDPRAGDYAGPFTLIDGGGLRWLGSAPSDKSEDWVVVVKRVALSADIDQISVGNPGTQKLKLDAGPAHAGDNYRILSSSSGVYPGTDIVGLILPLNWDGLTTYVLSYPDGPFTSDFTGTLDANGLATAQLNLAPSILPGLVGMSLNHAFLAGPGYVPTFVSNAVLLEITP